MLRRDDIYLLTYLQLNISMNKYDILMYDTDIFIPSN